jgi:hypothetical protein
LPADLCNLPNYTAYVRLLDPAGHPTGPFSLRTQPPVEVPPEDSREEIVRRTALRRSVALPPQRLEPPRFIGATLPNLPPVPAAQVRGAVSATPASSKALSE